MTTRIAERVDGWESRPFSGGYSGLRELAESSFSGVVVAGRATCCLLNGTIVGIIDGTIDDFEDTTGTIREAPSPALPLLLIMQDRGDEVRARYYSEETPLSAADQKLSDGGFTGYVELSENVLSGDYYVVYHGGRSMSVAYVGESEKMLTDDEAFERADDEVGIYKVYPVDIEPIEIPEPEPEPAAAAVVGDDDEQDTTESVADEPDAAEEAFDEEDSVSSADEEPASASADSESDEDEHHENSEPESTAEGGVAHRDESSTEREQSGESRRADDDRERSTDERDSTGTERERASGERGRTRSDRERTGDDREQRRQSERSASSEQDDRGRRDRADTAQVDERSQRARTARESEDELTGQRDSRTERESTGTEPPRRDRDRRQDQRGRESQSRATDQRQSTETRGRIEDTQREPAGHSEEPRTGGRETGEQPRQSDPLGSPTGDTSESDSGGFGDSGELERRAIPSVDPDRTWREGEGGSSAATRTTLQSRQIKRNPDTVEERSHEPASQQAEQSRTQTSQSERGRQPDQQSSELRQQLQDREDEIDALERELSDLEADYDVLEDERADLEAERNRLEDELESVRAERDELQAEVEQLRSKVADLESQLADASTDAGGVHASVQLSPAEAIEQTNLFVRYGSKGEATLEAAHSGKADKEDVLSNLNLEYHTQFDAEDAAVGDQGFETFLTETIQYRFVDWAVHDLIFEIRETGHKGALQDLYDALPRLDRAELNGSVSVKYVEDGQEHREQVTFDIVLRDRMGNPLAVANINDSREAATGDMMTSLVTEATHVGESHDTLVGAFFITSSFFDPEALETASEATGGGLLSRDKRESFVRLSRKQGYHLCLAEARSEKFHLTVPEL